MASNPTPRPWDVFISLRGRDTRKTFTSHLYAALHRISIHTYMDDPELRHGEVISDALVQAIREAKTCVVVLSENYASSKWCLIELVEILSKKDRLVLPVFYHVKPWAQEDTFNEAFEDRKSDFDENILNNWREALIKVRELEGYYVSNYSSEAVVVQEIVDRIEEEIYPKTLDVAKYPVGLDSHVEAVTALIKSRDPEKITKIGIHGMVGVGKTTLAKAVYNKIYKGFQGSSYLKDVRELSRTKKGRACLQQQLITDVLKCKNIIIDNVGQEIELLRARLGSIKVLIVIDDFDNLMPLDFLEWSFGLESLLIITTRNEDVLDLLEVEARYEVNELGAVESRQLFSQHAFGDDNIPHTFRKLSEEILQCAGGLPLALEFFGSNLRKEGKIGIDELKQLVMANVEKKLLISYDGLKQVDPMLQDIFLDIACFFIGQKKEEVLKILRTCYTFANLNFAILVKRCFLRINSRDELEMHDLIRDIGRNIVHKNSPGEPEKYSRLWELKDINNVLKSRKGTEVIECIVPYKFDYQDEFEKVSFSTETFKEMSNLRFLHLYGHLTGSFEQTFEDLRWLRWDRCPLTQLPSEFDLPNLVILQLPRSKLTSMFELNKVPRVFEKLKILDMSNSVDLTTTPDFTTLLDLETLDLEGCKSLEVVHESIGRLERLVTLNLRYCKILKSLPDSICRLRALEVLHIGGCKSLQALPDQLGRITSLRELNVRSTMIEMIPNIIQLSFLDVLDLSYCGRLLSISELPPGLKRIKVQKCWSLKRLPNLSHLKQLRELDLECCRDLPELQVKELTCLKTLILSNCDNLVSISELPPNLERLSISRWSVERLLNLSGLKQLKELDIKVCSLSLDIQGLDELTSLEAIHLTGYFSYSALSATSHSALSATSRLFQVTVFEKLKTLVISGFRELTRTPDFATVPYLETLNLEGCESLREVHVSIGKLERLVTLSLRGCTILRSLPDSICRLRALKVLHIDSCKSLQELPTDLGYVECLQVLSVSCLSVSKLPDSIGRLSNLVELCLRDNENLTNLPDSIFNLRRMKALDLSGCDKLVSIFELPPNLERIKAQDCKSLERLPNLSNLKQLQNLNLRNCRSLIEIGGLEELTCLEQLDIDGCNKLLSISELPPNLERIKAQRCWCLERLPNLSNLKQLQDLNLRDCGRLIEIGGLEELSYLERLDIGDCLNLVSISELPPGLKRINFKKCYSLPSIPYLSGLKQLKELDISYCRALGEIQGLDELTCLEHLCLTGCNLSLVGSTLTRRFFQILSGFEHQTRIWMGPKEFPGWMRESSKVRRGPRMSFDLQPNASHNLTGIIFCFYNYDENIKVHYSIENITSGFIKSDEIFPAKIVKDEDDDVDRYRCRHWYSEDSSMIIVVPIDLSIRDGDYRLVVSSHREIALGIHLLYGISGYNDLESNKSWLTLGSSSSSWV